MTEGNESSQGCVADGEIVQESASSRGLTEGDKTSQRSIADWEIVQESWRSLSASSSSSLTEWQHSCKWSAADGQSAEVDKSWSLSG